MNKVVLSCGGVLLFLILIYAGISSPRLWSTLAVSSGANQTKFYTFCLDRIYATIDCDDSSYVDYLNNEELRFQKSTWIRILSVSGNESASTYVHKKLSDAVLKGEFDYFFFDYIGAAGKLQSNESRDLLFEIAKNDESYESVERALALSSLYMLDGINYSKQFNYKWVPGEDMRIAREAIVGSKGSCREFEDMMLIDKLYRSHHVR